MAGILGTSTNSPTIDAGTLCRTQSLPPGVICGSKLAASPPMIDGQTRKLAAIAYGEASTNDIEEEIRGIAFAVANRARAWDNKTLDQLLAADPNYTYAISDGNARYALLMSSSTEEIRKARGMTLAVEAAKQALENRGLDPSEGGFWWDGLDFKTNYKRHPKVKDGFRFGDPSHNIFDVEEVAKESVTYWMIKDKTGKEVKGKERGRYSCVWVSTAAHGSTIFWKHDPDFLQATGCREYR